MKCFNCSQEIIKDSKPRIRKYCIICAPIVAKEQIRIYQKARDNANRTKRLEKLNQLYNQAIRTPITTLAYIAGLFDGEGSVCIVKNKPKREGLFPCYALHIDISNQDINTLNFIKEIFKIGSIHNAGGYNYKWRSSNQRASIFLKCLLPYLRIKHKQAIIGIEFQSLINKEYHGFLNQLPQAQIDVRESLRQKMLTLNHFYRAKSDT